MTSALVLSYVYVALYGLAFGSFLNVCISRLPRGESIVLPRSHCPRCNHPIRWYDNIPLVSYLVLRARCRDCHALISPLYPAVEALTAVLLMLTFHVYGLGPEFIKYSLFGMLLIVLIFTDLLDRRIPHAVTIFGISRGTRLQLLHSRRYKAAGLDSAALERGTGRQFRLHCWRRRGSIGGRRTLLRCGRDFLPFGRQTERISGVR